MDWYRVSKYDPAFRHENGSYRRDEWTSVSDIGRSFDGVVLDVETYLTVEDAYVRAVGEFMADAGVSTLEVVSLKPPVDLDSLRRLGLPDADELTQLVRELREGTQLSGPTLDQVCRLCLREVLPCRLESPGRLVVGVGDDFYLHIGTTAPSERAIAKVHELGLFVHDAPDLAARRE